MEQSLPLVKRSRLTGGSGHMLHGIPKSWICFQKAPTVKFQLKEHLTHQ